MGREEGSDEELLEADEEEEVEGGSRQSTAASGETCKFWRDWNLKLN